jgi:hypothetical protein
MKIVFSARQSFLVTLSITGVMLILNTAAIVAQFVLGFPENKFFVRLLNMEYENNLPTSWSAMLLLYASALLYCLSKNIFKKAGKYKWLWALLSLAFFYLAMDEAFELHEKLMGPTSNLLELSGIFYYSWIIPAGIALMLMGIVYLKFIFNLPIKTRYLFIISCVIYAGSAIGFELLEGPIDQAGNWMNLPYTILVTLEETLEMFGICLFTYAVIDYTDKEII